jgi:class 3 adenylate cyclase/tetratricopeptide (TPR) repeat protein
LITTENAAVLDAKDANRRRVTVLIADLQSSTAAIQHLDPEDAAQVLDPALNAMIDAVEAYQGTVVSVRGDGILAVFGAPSTSEDHALRGCLAALAILQQADQATPGGMAIRIGVHCGEVMFRRVRRGEGSRYDVAGVPVHLAARLEQTAPPNTASLSAAAYDLTKEFVNADPLPPLSAKGIDQPIERYSLLGVKDTASRWDVRRTQKLSPFVGRAGEMAILAKSLVESSTTPTLCRITGPAGIGKSRLAYEFIHAVGSASYVMELPGNPYARYTVLQPVSIWLRRLFNFRAGDTIADYDAKISQVISRDGCLNESDDIWLKMLLGLKVDGPLPPEFSKNIKIPQIADLITKLLRTMAAGRNIIIVCDDVDRFDQPSRDLLEAIVPRIDVAGVLAIVTIRHSTSRKLLSSLATKSLHLSPLSLPDAGRLLASISSYGRPDPAFAAECIRKAGGNPLFLEEVAALMTRTAVPKDETLRSADIPDRVEVLIADRFLRLPKEQRELLQLSAIVGLDVPVPIVAKLSGRSESSVYQQLLKLQVADLLYETRRYPALQFSFKHSLTRDVAYNMILKATRRHYHEKLLNILEDDKTGTLSDISDALCSHAIHAEQWDKAVRYLRTAAKAAIDRGGYRQAKDHLSLALDIARKQPDTQTNTEIQIDVLLELRGLLGSSGKYLEAESVLEDAEALVERTGDAKRYATIITLRVHLLNILGDLDRALELGRRSAAAARRTGDALLAGRAVFGLGQTHFNRGDFVAADRAFRRSIELAQQAPQVLQFNVGTLSVTAHGSRALALACRGDFSEARGAIEAAEQLARGTGRPYEIAFTGMAHGFVELQKCRAESALGQFRAGLRVAEERDLDQLLPPLTTGIGQALLIAGPLEEAVQWLSRAYEVSRRHNRYMMQVWAASGLALAHLRSRRHAVADRHSNEAVEVASHYGFRGFLVPAERIRGIVLAAGKQDRQAAVDALAASLALAQELSMRPEIAHCHAALAQIESERAEFHAAEADHLYRELQMSTRSA